MTPEAPEAEPRELTVAHVRERGHGEAAEILFLESARVYELPAAHPEFTRLLELARVAAEEQRVVSVLLAAPRSEVIADLRLR